MPSGPCVHPAARMDRARTTDLGFDELGLIFASLNIPDLGRAARVCSVWREVAFLEANTDQRLCVRRSSSKFTTNTINTSSGRRRKSITVPELWQQGRPMRPSAMALAPSGVASAGAGTAAIATAERLRAVLRRWSTRASVNAAAEPCTSIRSSSLKPLWRRPSLVGASSPFATSRWNFPSRNRLRSLPTLSAVRQLQMELVSQYAIATTTPPNAPDLPACSPPLHPRVRSTTRAIVTVSGHGGGMRPAGGALPCPLGLCVWLGLPHVHSIKAPASSMRDPDERAFDESGYGREGATRERPGRDAPLLSKRNERAQCRV